MADLYKPCIAKAEENLQSPEYDGVVLVSNLPPGEQPSPFGTVLAEASKLDQSLGSEIGVFSVNLPSKRFIYSPTGPICPDYDDVRSFADAAKKGISRALRAGVKSPLLVVPSSDTFKQAELVTVLGALEALYVPIMVREDAPNKVVKPKTLAVYFERKECTSSVLTLANAIEAGRFVARDIGGGDPERMAPPQVEKYVSNVFGSGSVKVEVLKGTEFFVKEYPLFAAVNRAASVIERHQGRIIYLTYEPQDAKNITDTLMFVGKGVTYDTGGADIKAGGVMAGMSRDKCGAAAVAGFMKVVDELKPQNLKVVAALCMVRNSVGENCYVSDEVITARSGARVRVGNTDAEGRMAMADALCRMKELAAGSPNPRLFTVATLTGHAVLAVGEGYSIVQDNGPAREEGNARKLQDAGALIGDPFEISTMRREDLAFHKAKSVGDDLLQCNNAPSSRTKRGHQTPGAFLLIAAGLEKHGSTAELPLKYSHLDIAGSAGDLPDEPTGAPIPALVTRFFPKF